MRGGLVRKRHKKLVKAFTLVGSIFGLIVTLLLVILLAPSLSGENFLFTNDLRTYTAAFYSDGAMVSERTYRRGEVIEQPAIPEKQSDGLKSYVFIGWDLTGEGIPDVIPYSMYYSFNAHAVFADMGNLNLSLEDLMNMDIETIMKLMEDLNVDWEQFMDMFDLSLEDLLQLFQDNPILTYTSSGSQYITYFRTTSYGDFNYRSKKFNNPSIYDSTRISENSVNPLRFTGDKLKTAFSLGTLPEGFGFVSYNINYGINHSPYPAPDCEIDKGQSDPRINTDAISLSEPIEGQYLTEGAYCPAYNSIISLLKAIGFSNSNITKDEREYRNYARDHYINVPNEYISVIDEIIEEQEWDKNDYYFVNDIGSYVEQTGRFSLIDEDGNITVGADKNEDPIFGLLENDYGSDYDFNTLAVMIFRRLGIPARMVQGYISPMTQAYPAVNIVTFLNQHYWCEIYVDGVGWMICDCTNGEQLLGFNPYGGTYDNQSNDISDPTEDPIPDPEPSDFEEPELVTSDISGNVSMEGPGYGDGERDIEVATFTSSYEGTLYLRSASYNTYSPDGNWTRTFNGNVSTNSPLFYTYQVASQLFKSQSLQITYRTNMRTGISPEYPSDYPSNSAVYSNDSIVTKEVPELTRQTYTTIDFDLTTNNLKELIKQGQKNPSSEKNNYYNDYVLPYYTNYDSSNQTRNDLFDAFVSRHDLNEYLTADKWPELIVRVCNGFQNDYRYNINFDAYPSGIDPVVSFMTRGEGICNNFATAAVLMYRYLGVPARFVTGYGTQSRGSGYTNSVTARTAHAWVEVYHKDVGWIKVDPTGFSDGHGDGGLYGDGFGGNGANFEEINRVNTLSINYDAIGLPYNTVTYGNITYPEYYKTYDGQPLEFDPESLIDGHIKEGHRVEITGIEELKALGAGLPDWYDYFDLEIHVYDIETGEDVTNDEYTIEDEGFSLYIQPISLDVVVYYNGGSYSYPFDIANYPNNFECYTNNGNLLEGHHFVFTPDSKIITESGEYTITGTVRVLDQNGEDVTDIYYSITDIQYPKVTF